MTNALLNPNIPLHATPDMAHRMMQCSPVFSARRPVSEADADHALKVADYLRKPAARPWIAGRVVTLLSHYFVAQTDEKIAAAVADDWCSMLAEYPAWAIANACRWWMSRENPRKHCKPLPGDIQDRAHIETGPIRSAEIMARLGPERARGNVPLTEPTATLTPHEIAARKAETDSMISDLLGSLKAKSMQQEANAAESYQKFRFGRDVEAAE